MNKFCLLSVYCFWMRFSILFFKCLCLRLLLTSTIVTTPSLHHRSSPSFTITFSSSSVVTFYSNLQSCLNMISFWCTDECRKWLRLHQHWYEWLPETVLLLLRRAPLLSFSRKWIRLHQHWYEWLSETVLLLLRRTLLLSFSLWTSSWMSWCDEL